MPNPILDRVPARSDSLAQHGSTTKLVALLNANPRTQKRIGLLELWADQSRNATAASQHAVQLAVEQRGDARGEIDRLIERARSQGQEADPGEMADRKKSAAQSDELLRLANAGNKTTVKTSIDRVTVLNKILGTAKAARDIEELEITVPRSDLLGTIESRRTTLKMLDTQIIEAEESPGPAQAKIDALVAKLDAIRAKAKVKVATGEGATLYWPIQTVHGAEARSGEVVAVTDPTPFIVDANYGALVDDIKKQVAAEYLTLPSPMSAAEKRSTIARLKADRAQVEYAECAAIWLAKEAGLNVEFRPQADPACVLGIKVIK